jgi:uroporphyrinogen-III decarboxylase
MEEQSRDTTRVVAMVYTQRDKIEAILKIFVSGTGSRERRSLA